MISLLHLGSLDLKKHERAVFKSYQIFKHQSAGKNFANEVIAAMSGTYHVVEILHTFFQTAHDLFFHVAASLVKVVTGTGAICGALAEVNMCNVGPKFPHISNANQCP